MIITFRFISDESDDFVLDVNINSDQTFEELHIAIQNALNYDSSQMASFFNSNTDWEKLDEITLLDMGNDQPVKIMKDTIIEEFYQEKNERILYVFDFFAERLLFGSVTRTINQESPIPLPSISKYEGKAPEQLSLANGNDESFLDDLLGEDFSESEITKEPFDKIDDLDNDISDYY